MKLYTPDYYHKFKCIAGKCRHSCCIGWEIDIDSHSLERYRNVPGEFGKQLRSNIAQTDEAYHFRLCQDERCPFLNGDNLCEIIINMGNDALCQICSDHPRFRNYFSDRTETGIGLCCEAAAELVITNKEKAAMQLVEAEKFNKPSEEDEYFFGLRQKYLNILQNRELSLGERFKTLLCVADAKAEHDCVNEWVDVYLSLEHLDSEWVKMLNNLKASNEIQLTLLPEWELELEQLSVYFIMRHLADGRFDMSIPERVAFAVHATQFISTLASVCNPQRSVEALVNTARMYSSEIEYSDENLDTILNICAEYNFEN